MHVYKSLCFLFTRTCCNTTNRYSQAHPRTPEEQFRAPSSSRARSRSPFPIQKLAVTRNAKVRCISDCMMYNVHHHTHIVCFVHTLVSRIVVVGNSHDVDTYTYIRSCGMYSQATVSSKQASSEQSLERNLWQGGRHIYTSLYEKKLCTRVVRGLVSDADDSQAVSSDRYDAVVRRVLSWCDGEDCDVSGRGGEGGGGRSWWCLERECSRKGEAPPLDISRSVVVEDTRVVS